MMTRYVLLFLGDPFEKKIVELNVRKVSGVTVDARVVVVPGVHKKDSNGGSSTKD
jgi:hypothetical protein